MLRRSLWNSVRAASDGGLSGALGTALAALLLGSPGAAAQSVGPSSAALGDPAKCVVVVESFENVGFRISDAQAVAETVLVPLKKRVGHQAAMYEGVLKSAEQMKRMLGPTAEGAGPQETQLAHYTACKEASPWHIKASFGLGGKGKAKRHWIEVTCRKKGADAVVDKARVEGESFILARDALHKAMDTFCLQIPDISMIPVEPMPGARNEGPPGMSKKEIKPWSPPPPRP